MEKILYVVQWILEEFNKEHQNIDPRKLDDAALREMAASAVIAWDEGAR